MAALVPYLLILLPPVLAALGAGWGGCATFLAPALLLVAVPVLDLVLGERRGTLAAGAPAGVLALAHRGLLHASVPLVLGFTIWAASRVGALGIPEALGLVLSAGTVTSLGIPIAHELIHKRQRVDRAAGLALLFNAAYMHFAIEHVHGHHVRVATPDDPATARLGESFYRFYPRAVITGWRSAWDIEKARLGRKQRAVFGPYNQMLWYGALPLAFAAGLALLFGPPAGVFFLAQAVLAFSLLELVSYLEHYGLAREPLPGGGYARVTPMHSWSSSRRLSNWFMANLQLHADHHLRAGVPYQVLTPIAGSPELPASYGAMALVALVPPLFFRVMDGRVRALTTSPAQRGGGAREGGGGGVVDESLTAPPLPV